MSHPKPGFSPKRMYQLEVSVEMKRGGHLMVLARGDNHGEDIRFYWIPKKSGGKLYEINDDFLVDIDRDVQPFLEYVAQQEWESDESAWEEHCERLGDIARERAVGIDA